MKLLKGEWRPSPGVLLAKEREAAIASGRSKVPPVGKVEVGAETETSGSAATEKEPLIETDGEATEIEIETEYLEIEITDLVALVAVLLRIDPGIATAAARVAVVAGVRCPIEAVMMAAAGASRLKGAAAGLTLAAVIVTVIVAKEAAAVAMTAIGEDVRPSPRCSR